MNNSEQKTLKVGFVCLLLVIGCVLWTQHETKNQISFADPTRPKAVAKALATTTSVAVVMESPTLVSNDNEITISAIPHVVMQPKP